MNFRAQTWRAASVRQVGICLVSMLLLVPALAAPSLSSEARTAWVSRPYLTVVVAAPLRFEESPAPPHVSPVLAAAPAETPRPVLSPGPAPEPSGAKEPMTEHAALTPSVPPVSGTSAPGTSPKDKPEKPAKPPPAILPDEIQPKVRPEDFLPFFQFPGSNAGPSDVAPPPEPGKLPPSSATYRQQ